MTTVAGDIQIAAAGVAATASTPPLGELLAAVPPPLAELPAAVSPALAELPAAVPPPLAELPAAVPPPPAELPAAAAPPLLAELQQRFLNLIQNAVPSNEDDEHSGIAPPVDPTAEASEEAAPQMPIAEQLDAIAATEEGEACESSGVAGDACEEERPAEAPLLQARPAEALAKWSPKAPGMYRGDTMLCATPATPVLPKELLEVSDEAFGEARGDDEAHAAGTLSSDEISVEVESSDAGGEALVEAPGGDDEAVGGEAPPRPALEASSSAGPRTPPRGPRSKERPKAKPKLRPSQPKGPPPPPWKRGRTG